MKIEVLDQGYVELIECWGTGRDGQDAKMFDGGGHDFEIGIVEAARQSTQGSFRGWDVDRKLLKRLTDHNHATPFEFSGMVIEVQAPLMVFREWHRHRTQSYNEMSARYAPLPDLYYEVDAAQVLPRADAAYAASDKQTASIAPPDAPRIEAWIRRDRELSRILEEHYREGLAAGVPKELARKKMPVDHYSRMRAAANLRNWFAFLDLRLAPGVMLEMQQYATAVSHIVQAKFPQAWRLRYGE